jgi:hypothetical protein
MFLKKNRAQWTHPRVLLRVLSELKIQQEIIKGNV